MIYLLESYLLLGVCKYVANTPLQGTSRTDRSMTFIRNIIYPEVLDLFGLYSGRNIISSNEYSFSAITDDTHITAPILSTETSASTCFLCNDLLGTLNVSSYVIVGAAPERMLFLLLLLVHVSSLGWVSRTKVPRAS